jgi:hypothetical protein
MAAPIRPPAWPPAASNAQTSVQAANVRPGRNDARLSAQKAFFEAALAGKPAAAAVASREPERASLAATPLQATRAAAAAEARAADRLPPPGSIVNILV